MHEEYDCPWQSASGAQSVTSLSKIEGFREFEADLSALFFCNKKEARCKKSLPCVRIWFMVRWLYGKIKRYDFNEFYRNL